MKIQFIYIKYNTNKIKDKLKIISLKCHEIKKIKYYLNKN
jgi:hypothetical protein